MADDGIGLEALRALQEGWAFDPHVELVDGGTWGMNILHFIEGAKRVLLVDAIRAGAEPGALVILERDELPRYLSTKISTHQIDLREVLAVAEFRGTLPADTVAIGVQPDRVEMSAQLSPVVRDRLDQLVARVIERLQTWGHAASQKVAERNA
jgi:hydrogenase maturation protease